MGLFMGKRGRVWVLVALAAAALAMAAFWRTLGPRSGVKRDPGSSILLISVDTLRADALGAYGRAAARTPWIDRLAAAGVRFERAYAHNVVTLPSHANLLSGRYPLAHGVRDNSGFRFPAGTPTLATLLKSRGWRTGAFVSAFPLDSRFGLGAGFDVYDDRLGGAETTQAAFLMPERPGALTVEAALRWRSEHQAERTLTLVHLYEPHFPYEPPEPFAAAFASAPYHGEVAAADAALEPLLRPLLEAGPAGRTLVVFTSDHGEALGEHGELTHGVFAYESTLRVPLVVYAPGLLSARIVREPVRHVDVLPTVLDLLGIEAPAGLAGRSLAPLLDRAGPEPEVAYFEALSTSLNQGWAPLHGVLDGSLKYVDLPIPELYDVEADPGETKNLVASRPQDREHLRAHLADLRAQDHGSRQSPEDAATREKLRALGYLSGAPPAPRERYTEEDDPKRLIAIERRTADLIRLFREGDLGGALALALENVRQRPDTPLGHLHVAYLERARGSLPAAVDAARRALALRPDDAETAALLATYLTEAGRAREAAALLEPYAAQAEPDLGVLTARGMALAAEGRYDQALATFERARGSDPANALVLVNLGTVHLMAGDRASARRAFEAALDVDPRVARAHNSLGVIAAQEGRLEEAVERWRRAVALDPRDYQTLFNLGTTLRRQGRAAEARPYLEGYLRAAPAALEARDIARVRQWLSQAGS
jgi:arylsulfatase A-like enzyme/Flp pilus assembly protein TadD